MPKELANFKEKIMLQAKSNKALQQYIEQSEILSPWVVTNFDERIEFDNEHFTKLSIQGQDTQVDLKRIIDEKNEK